MNFFIHLNVVAFFRRFPMSNYSSYAKDFKGIYTEQLTNYVQVGAVSNFLIVFLFGVYYIIFKYESPVTLQQH